MVCQSLPEAQREFCLEVLQQLEETRYRGEEKSYGSETRSKHSKKLSEHFHAILAQIELGKDLHLAIITSGKTSSENECRHWTQRNSAANRQLFALFVKLSTTILTFLRSSLIFDH